MVEATKYPSKGTVHTLTAVQVLHPTTPHDAQAVPSVFFMVPSWQVVQTVAEEAVRHPATEETHGFPAVLKNVSWQVAHERASVPSRHPVYWFVQAPAAVL